jgi:hypothetical protein
MKKLFAPVLGSPGRFGSGYREITLRATSFIRFGGIRLPGNSVRTPVAVVVRGSAIRNGMPAEFNVCEKSPARCSSVGTVKR